MRGEEEVGEGLERWYIRGTGGRNGRKECDIILFELKYISKIIKKRRYY